MRPFLCLDVIRAACPFPLPYIPRAGPGPGFLPRELIQITPLLSDGTIYKSLDILHARRGYLDDFERGGKLRPAPFDHAKPDSIEEVFGLLNRHGDKLKNSNLKE